MHTRAHTYTYTSHTSMFLDTGGNARKSPIYRFVLFFSNSIRELLLLWRPFVILTCTGTTSTTTRLVERPIHLPSFPIILYVQRIESTSGNANSPLPIARPRNRRLKSHLIMTNTKSGSLSCPVVAVLVVSVVVAVSQRRCLSQNHHH